MTIITKLWFPLTYTHFESHLTKLLHISEVQNYKHEDYSCCQAHGSLNTDHRVAETLQTSPPQYVIFYEWKHGSQYSIMKNDRL
jgi:hypothetical protein